MTYFDYCATTPVHPDVKQAMLASLEADFGNPSSMHDLGQTARQLIQKARKSVAEGIGATPSEIIFTSGATEANNLALSGVLAALPPEKNHIITTQIEHHATLHTLEHIEHQGFEVTQLPVKSHGRIDINDFKAAIRPSTAMASIMMINNETGVIQPVSEIALISKKENIILHTDAVQALGCSHINVGELNVDLLSLSAHKIYGPKGIGALFVRKGTPIRPQIHGGSQEYKLRAGTENVPGIIGLGEAVNLVSEMKLQESKRLSGLRIHFIRHLKQLDPGIIINGADEFSAPHITSVSFPGVDGEMLLFNLNQAGYHVSLGSACNAESIEPSHVLLAMGLPQDRIDGTIRFSFGYPTRKEEIDRLVNDLGDIIQSSRF